MFICSINYWIRNINFITGQAPSISKLVNWIIIGAMTGLGSSKHQPKREWIEEVVSSADDAGVPVFMKESLIPIVGEENMRWGFPWEVKERCTKNW